MLNDLAQSVVAPVLGGWGPAGLEAVAWALGLLLTAAALILLVAQFAADAVAWWCQPGDGLQHAEEIATPGVEIFPPGDIPGGIGTPAAATPSDPKPEADHQPDLRSIIPPVACLNSLVTPPVPHGSRILSLVAAA